MHEVNNKIKFSIFFGNGRLFTIREEQFIYNKIQAYEKII